MCCSQTFLEGIRIECNYKWIRPVESQMLIRQILEVFESHADVAFREMV